MQSVTTAGSTLADSSDTSETSLGDSPQQRLRADKISTGTEVNGRNALLKSLLLSALNPSSKLSTAAALAAVPNMVPAGVTKQIFKLF
jgi:hypothetical protein